MISDPECALHSVVDAPKDALFMVAVEQLFDPIASILPHNNKVYDSKLLFPSPEIKTSLTNWVNCEGAWGAQEELSKTAREVVCINDDDDSLISYHREFW